MATGTGYFVTATLPEIQDDDDDTMMMMTINSHDEPDNAKRCSRACSELVLSTIV